MPAAIDHFVSLRILFSKTAMLKSSSFSNYENEKRILNGLRALRNPSRGTQNIQPFTGHPDRKFDNYVIA
jgi:hypothetical protein